MADLEKVINKRDELIKKINNLEATLISEKNVILKSINSQRFYSFSNNVKIIFDRKTGVLWANTENFPYVTNGNYYDYGPEIYNIASSFDFGFDGFNIPTNEQLWSIVKDNEFPNTDRYHRIQNMDYWFVIYNGGLHCKYLYNSADANSGIESNKSCALIPCSSVLVKNKEYEINVLPDNTAFTEEEKSQLTLNIFLENDLLPIFDNSSVTQYYKNVYYEYPKKLKELNEELKYTIDPPIESSDFDYTVLLLNYNIDEINNSIIKYYRAIQSWIESLLFKFGNYEKNNESVLGDISSIGIVLSKKYKNSEHLSDEENEYFKNRQLFLSSKISLGMNSVKTKLLSLKEQADNIEYRIDEIDSGNDALRELAVIEKEERASFAFVAENTAKIIVNALRKVEYFESNHEFVKWIIETWEKWNESYNVFKTSYKSNLSESCKEDSIDEEICLKWYNDWQSLRFTIEKKFLPLIEKELRQRIPMINNDSNTVSQQIIFKLEDYKNSIDKFYREERKGIYQNYVFQANGEIQDKLETESRIYKFTAQLQKELQDIIFNCEKSEDRIFIFDWAGDLLDIQIDDIVELLADNELQGISETVLTEFSQLKQRNYEFYLADAKSYGEEQEKRDKEFNSLLFKMRKGIR